MKKRRKLQHTLRKMKLLVVCMVAGFLTCHASAFAQNDRISLTVNDSQLSEVFQQIEKLSGYMFIYQSEDLMGTDRITLAENDATLSSILDKCLANTGLTYTFRENLIIIRNEARQQADEKRVTGTVVDTKGHPLPGVAVIIKGTTLGVSTDHEGKFAITLPDVEDIRLVFSFIGMRPEEIAYAGQKEINVTLHEEATEIDEVVVTGYQVVDRRKNTSAVTSVKVDEIMIPSATSIDQMLQGRIPDLMVTTTSGEVGVTPRMRIRGTSTLIGNREPLWVVDGIIVQDPVDIAPEELNDPDYINRIGNAIAGLNPQDIDRIDVLKDAAATALYGTKAANGVIVVTTKKGHIGKPIITYSNTLTLRRRPRYTDRNVNVMNSAERIQFSRELVAQNYEYPGGMSYVGYEGLLRQLYAGEISQSKFEEEVAYLETVNTDWFDVLTSNSFSHQHTLSMTGGSEEGQYYASIGYSRDNDVIWDDNNERYTVVLNLDANLAPWLRASLGVNGNISSRKYYQEDLAPMDYAYKTSRAIPLYDKNGNYYYYQKKATTDNYTYYNYNILNELENSSHEQEGQSLTATANLQFDIRDWLNLDAIFSYSTSHTTIDGWWGEKTYHVAVLRGTEYGVLPEPAEEVWDDLYEEWYTEGGNSELPYGGELSRQESNNRSWTMRLQANVNEYFGIDSQHNLNGAVGFEMSSTRYKQYEKVERGYYKDRGMSFVDNIDVELWPDYAQWLAENIPSITDSKTNTVSAYASLSYSYYNYFTANINGRIDGSNGFGDQSNDKLLPIWSASANWNLSEHSWLDYKWIDMLRLKFSFGYQGNMLSDQTPVMIISKEPLDSYFNENVASVVRYPNPDLKWETTTSYNLGLEFSLFQSRLAVEASLYWKHTKDAFMTKNISSINGVLGNSYVINGGDVDNNGYSIALTVSPVNTKNFRWTLSTSWSETFNKVNSEPDAQTYELDDFLNGTAIVEGEAIGTFYSYKFMGLSPVTGAPIFDDGGDNKEALYGLSKYDTYTRVLEPSGLRDPKISGSLNTSLRYKNLRLSGSFAYSLGNKVRLFGMYANADDVRNADQIHPEYNVHKDYLRRWRHPGDELKTDIPAIISPSNPYYYNYQNHWSQRGSYEGEPIATSVWTMYDYGNHRVVSGNYLKCSNISMTYEFGERVLSKLQLSRLALTLSTTNLFTICAKELDGQAPTQTGFSTTQLSDRPTYSFGLTVSF